MVLYMLAVLALVHTGPALIALATTTPSKNMAIQHKCKEVIQGQDLLGTKLLRHLVIQHTIEEPRPMEIVGTVQLQELATLL